MAILKRVRKAIPNDLKCACSPSPWHGCSSSHSEQTGAVRKIPDEVEFLPKPTKSSEEFDAKGSKNEEQKKEEEAEISHLGESLHHSVQQGTNSLGHFQELENPGNSENPHDPDNSGVDDEGLTFYLLKTNSYYGQDSYGQI